MYNPQEIVVLLETIANKRNISINKLLQEIGLDKNVVYRMKIQNQMPSVDKFVKMADYLNCSVDYLLGRAAIEEDKDLNPYLAEEMAIQRRLNKRLEEYRARQASDNVSNS